MLHAVILAGGSGTRFWPASRRLLPKQLLPLGDPAAGSLLAQTVDRIRPLCPPERVLVATGEHLVEATRAALPEVPAASFLGEPAARNTAPCIVWAASVAARRDPDAVVMVLPSDQVVRDRPAYLAALELSIRTAESGVVTTVGIAPTRPDTGYGYIELGEEMGGGVWRARRFVEKPTRERAEEYLASGRFVWNAGMFFFRARVLLEAVERHLPELARGVEAIAAAEERGPVPGAEALRRVFPTLPSISVDHGLMERLEELAVVPASFGWSDLGSWESAWEHAERDASGNAVPVGTVLVDARENLVARFGGEPRTVALVGVSGLCVVETPDALLVLPKDRAQDVRLVVEALRASGRGELT